MSSQDQDVVLVVRLPNLSRAMEVAECVKQHATSVTVINPRDDAQPCMINGVLFASRKDALWGDDAA